MAQRRVSPEPSHKCQISHNLCMCIEVSFLSPFSSVVLSRGFKLERSQAHLEACRAVYANGLTYGPGARPRSRPCPGMGQLTKSVIFRS